MIAIAGLQPDAGGEGLGGFFQVGKVVLAGIDGVAHAFQHGAGAASGRAGPAHAGGQVCGRGIHFAEGVEEAGKGLGRARLGVGEFGQFHAIEFKAREDGVSRGLLQVGDQLPVALAGKGPDIDVEGVGKGKEDAGGDRALVALQQVEIAGRQAQGLGGLGLGEAALTPQAAQAGAGKDLLEGLCVTHCMYQNLQHYFMTM